MSSPVVSPLLLLRLRRRGIVDPILTVRAARDAKLGLPLACAMLVEESGGGRNEWGHDPTIFVGGYDAANKRHYGPLVTQAAYVAYAIQRAATGQCQGAGPTQLTSAGLQEQADDLGGCWQPRCNLAVGFHTLHDLVELHGLDDGVAAYNGSGPAAWAYAERLIALANRFKAAKCGTVVGIY